MGNRLMRLIVTMTVLTFSAIVLAQTAQRPGAAGAQAAPRTADGKPDLSGVWSAARGGGEGGYEGAAIEPISLTPWGEEKFAYNQLPEYKGKREDQDPMFHCYPAGLARLNPPRQIPLGFPAEAIQIFQTPRKLVVFYHSNHEMRQIFTDGREHPEDLEVTWNGHSTAKWDGDTLVVDTVGLRDETWLDTVGHEHSIELRVAERIRRVDNNRLEWETTFTDPVALAKPYTKRAVLRLTPDLDFVESVTCDQYYRRKPYFGEPTEGGLLGISGHP